MAKRLNKNIVVGLTVAGMAVTTAAGVVMVLNLPKKDPQPFVEEAKKAAAKGDYVEASKRYQQAYTRARTGSDPAAANEYLLKAGEMSLSAGDARMAIRLWGSAILNNPEFQEAQEKIVKLFLEFAEMQGGDNWASLQTQAETLRRMSEKSKTKNYLGLHALGRALIAQRAVKESNAEEGKKHLIEAVNGDKSNPAYAKALADYYLTAGNVKDAAAVYDVLIANPAEDKTDLAKAYLNRGVFYSNEIVQKNIPDASAKSLPDLEKARELAPTNVDVLAGLGGYWHGRKVKADSEKAAAADIEDFRAKAKKCFEDAIQADPDHYVGYLQLMQLYYEDHRFDDALKVIDTRIARGIKRDHYLGWRNRQYMSVMRDAAFKVNLQMIGTIAAKTPDEFKQGLQKIKDRLNEIYKASVAELPGGADDPLALIMQARLLMLDENAYEAIKVLEKAKKLVPNAFEIHRLLADLYFRTDSPGLAEESLRLVMVVAPNDASILALHATVLVQLKRPDDAVNAANKALAIQPENQMALRAKLQAYEMQKNYKGIEEVQQAISKGKDSPREKLAQAALLRLEAGQGDKLDRAKLDEAEKLLKQVVEAEPFNDLAVRYLMGIFEQKQNSSAEALQILATVRAKVEKKLAEVAATQPTGEEKTDLQRYLTQLDMLKIIIDPKVLPAERVQRREELIRRGTDPYLMALDLYQLYYSMPDRADDAYKNLKEAYRLKPNEAQIIDTLFQTSLIHKDWALAEELTKKAVELGYERTGGYVYRGRILLARGSDAEPNLFAEAAREFRDGLAQLPSHAETHALLGRALLSMNQHQEAKASFLEARRLNPQNSSSAVGLAMLATLQGDAAEKQKYLAICEEVAPNNVWVRGELQENEDRRNPKQGIERREVERKQDPKNTENLVRLADLYAREGKLDQAASLYEECIKLDPNELRFARAYADFLAFKDPPDSKRALEILRKLVQSIDAGEATKKATAQLMLAAHLLAQGERNGPDAPSREDVDAAYEAAASISNIAEVQLEIGNYYTSYGQNQKAEEWFRRAVDSAKSEAQRDLRRRAHQLVIQTVVRSNDRGNRTADLKKETDLFRERYPSDTTGLLFQAEYFVALGRDSDAIKAYSEYIEKMPNVPVGHHRRGIVHYRRSEWEDAIKDLRQVKQLSPAYENYEPRLFLARAMEFAGHKEDAITELQTLIEESGIPSALQQLYNLYMELKRYDSAESLIAAREKFVPGLGLWKELRIKIALARNDAPGAIKIAEAAVNESKFAPGMVNILLSLYLQNGRYDELIAFVDTVPADKRDQSVVLRMASAYLGKKDIDKGLDLFTRTMNVPGANMVVLRDTFQLDLNERVSPDALLPLIKSRLEKNPQDRTCQFILGLIHDKRKEHKAYIQILRDMLGTVAPTTAPASQPSEKTFLIQELAMQLYYDKQYEECRALYQQMLAADPENPFALNNLASLLMDQFKDPKASLPYARRAAEKMRTNALVMDTLGWNSVLLKDYDQGISDLGRAVWLDWRVPAIHYHLAEGYYGRSQKSSGVDQQADLKQARAEVEQVALLISQKGEDRDGILDQVRPLAEKLGVKLPTLGAAKPATQPAR